MRTTADAAASKNGGDHYLYDPLRSGKSPLIINPSRKRRIAAGSGTKVEDVNRLLRQFEQMQKMMKQFGGKAGKRAKSAPHGWNARYGRNARRRRRIRRLLTFGINRLTGQ